MHRSSSPWVLLLSIALLVFCSPAKAAMAVVDVGAIAQLVQQVTTLQQQLQTVQSHLLQAQTEFASITGRRGMERLLGGTMRNYLPSDWEELAATIQSTASAYYAANAVLTQADLALLSPAERAQLEAARRTAALLQMTSRQALSNTSNRFAALQQLIDSIPAAVDQKAILDLQARIQAEQGMLQNESSKLAVLYQSAQADELARKQRTREEAIAGIGSLRTLPTLRLP